MEGQAVHATRVKVETDRHAWAQPRVEELGDGVFRIPLPLGSNALRAVNVYALVDDSGVDLIDGGDAIIEAREQLVAGFQTIGCGLGDIRNIFVTHYHKDHYTLAVELRRSLGITVHLGEEERANLQASRDIISGKRESSRLGVLRRAGGGELLADLGLDGHSDEQQVEHWEDPDHWIADGAALATRSRSLRAIHTPGHTRGHLVFRDAENEVLFAGDHVLPHITPSIGFEPADNRMALRDYLNSLQLLLTLPDTRLFPAHGPVCDSTHNRVRELLAHHDVRLAATLAAIGAGAATGYEAAQALGWTGRERRFTELVPMDRYLACAETTAHLEVLALRGDVVRRRTAEGSDIYTLA